MKTMEKSIDKLRKALYKRENKIKKVKTRKKKKKTNK